MQLTEKKIALAGLMLLASGCPDSDSMGSGSTGQQPGGSSSSGGAGDGATTPGMPTTDTADGSDESDGSDDNNPPDTGDEGDTTGDSDGGTTGALEEIDCAVASSTAVSTTPIPNARGYHGLVITPDGMLIGSDGASLIQSTYAGETSVFIPGTGQGEQMDWLPNGDIAFIGGGKFNLSLLRLGLDGTSQVIAGAVDAYSVVLGRDDMLYISGWGGLSRVDPVSGAQEVLFNNGPEMRAMGFSPDGSRAYIGTVGNATVYYVDFDDQMDPTTGLEVFATGVGNGSGWHDVVKVDACGNLFVADYDASTMWRVTPGGTVGAFWQTSFEEYGHGGVWGTGADGWKLDALYVPQPYNNNSVTEVVVGIPGREYSGPVVNAEPMMP